MNKLQIEIQKIVNKKQSNKQSITKKIQKREIIKRSKKKIASEKRK